MKFIGNMRSTLMQRKSYFTYKSCLVNKVELLDMRYLSGFFRTKMKEGEDVGAHVNSMIRSIEELQSLDFMINAQLQTDLILQSLLESFRQTIANFYMNKIESTLAELLNMLVTA